MSPRASSEKSSRSSLKGSLGSPKHGATVFYGRGGAGNTTKREEGESSPPRDLGTPTLKAKTYTTGRGGAGNMLRNDPEHPEKARERQDVDVPHVALEPERAYATGRGGAGNIHQLTSKERAEAKAYNDRVRSNSGSRNTREKVNDLAGRAKGFFGGHKASAQAV